MIEMTEPIRSDDYLRIPLKINSGSVQIEFVCNRAIDVAVLNSKEYKAFETEKDAEDDQKWNENERQLDFSVSLSGPEKYFLVLWNCNSSKTAIVAYKVTKL